MKDFFKKFVSQIQIENYIKNINGRKVIIWGASEMGKDLYNMLLKKKQFVYAFVDKKSCKSGFEFNGIKVEATELLIENKEKFYVFVADDYHNEIELFLNNNGYLEIEDYLYIYHKPIEIESNEEYLDLYGNKIEGIKGTKINFIGYNSILKINSNCQFEDLAKIYSSNGIISINEKSRFGKNGVIACVNSSISIGSECYFGEQYIINCIDNSNLNLGSQGFFGDNFVVSCIDNSSISVGECCTFEGSLFIFSHYNGVVKIGDDCMGSNYITVSNNDGHPIFDINTNTQINTNKSIFIGNHVWLGIKCTVISGSEIGDGSIIGANSLVSKKFPNNCTIAGNPGSLKRKDIAWDRGEIKLDLIDKRLYWNKTTIGNNM